MNQTIAHLYKKKNNYLQKYCLIAAKQYPRNMYKNLKMIRKIYKESPINYCHILHRRKIASLYADTYQIK